MQKKMWIILAIIAVLIVSSILVYYFKKSDNINNPPAQNECSIDSDCVKDSCCHAKGCAAKVNEPDCTGIMCSSMCEPGTLDCGQGECKCVNNKCEAKLN
jgi:hypothetical protein